ncbi:hypothetical protein BAUCODRAFT_158802 [Baudoinia panamericana UAMH 10762]|uniref:DUF8035 domain-containing protein n=1 Tax=Baudoinia panamericana (strain UAMH 10762) TaxID=717646 RepID=M2LJ14_BAUPA|nr:uncharacterized protein BAUCODRAFT_158802 [Baudoinia panamericana UAMH 10762]EMC94207.1 hypothetical protein BAUCODRAFT_158802 [Baudoinia panamericana UAMH 10762]
MEQQWTSTRTRTRAFSLHTFQPIPFAPSATSSAAPKMSYHRPLSPGGRRIQNPARVSDSFTDPYQQPPTRHHSYIASPRSSGVIPISTETFITVPQSAREPPRSAYSGRPRRSSLSDSQRSSTTGQIPVRSKPTVVVDSARPTSPLKGTRDRDSAYDTVTPATSQHKKVYAVGANGNAKLVANVDVPAGGSERHHKRRESVERSYRGATTDKDRGRKDYHTSTRGRGRDRSIDDEGAYSYTDAAGMYNTTEPRWREGFRPRRGSMDRGGSRDTRPVSIVDPSYNPRSSAKELGPPPSTRGWDKIDDSAPVRRASTRKVAASPTRGRDFAHTPNDPRDSYYVPPRASSKEGRSLAISTDVPRERYDQYGYEERPARHHERRNSVSRRVDPEVATRGFGIRSASKDPYERRSDESIQERHKYRDSGYAEPHRRDTAPELPHHEERRLEQEKRDRMLERERRRDDDRGYDHEVDRERARDRDRQYESETERERERQRVMEREPERERHHQRRDTVDRDYRKENGGDGGASGLAKAATGGLAVAAGAFGLNKIFNKDKDKDGEREKDRDRDRDYDRERDRGEKDRDLPRPEKEAERQRYEEPPRKEPRERRQRGPDSHTDDSAPYDARDREDRYNDTDRGFGFAFERPPEPPKAAPPIDRPRDFDRDVARMPQERVPERDSRPPPPVDRSRDLDREPARVPQERVQERNLEREHGEPIAVMPQPAIDADEDYRRRMEQVQRELARAATEEKVSSDSDPDRERRRREREQRQREKEERDFTEPKLNAGVGLTNFNEQPPPPQLRRSFEDTMSDTTASSGGQHALRRKPSILDEPMTAEPYQIIDNSASDRRENRVRIVDPPTEEEDRKPKGILKRPTQKFPEHPNAMREGVAPLKDATAKGIPPGARWTKIDRKLVNPEALEEAKERFEERLDCVIVLRVLTKEDIQKLADRTREIRGKRYPSRGESDYIYDMHDTATRDRTATHAQSERGRRFPKKRMWIVHGSRDFMNIFKHSLTPYSYPADERYEEERAERKAAKRKERQKARKEGDEYSDDSADEWKERAPKMLEAAPSSVGAGAGAASEADFVRENRDRRREREGEREGQYAMSGGLGRRDERA